MEFVMRRVNRVSGTMYRCVCRGGTGYMYSVRDHVQVRGGGGTACI